MSSRADPDGGVCLSEILDSFNAPLNEEHAWALCYQCARYFSERLRAAPSRGDLRVANEVKHVFLKADGNVHEKTLLPDDGDDHRKPFRNERDIVTGIGLIIYTTLDPCPSDGKERILDPDLEELLTDTITDELNSIAHHELDDEGIEEDTDDASASKPSHITLEGVISRCEKHLGSLTKSQVEAHYKAVIRAFVVEAIELSNFLEKVAQGNISLPSNSSNSDLGQLNFTDWSKFWIQVIRELRMGVKLKKVNFSKAPIEYELTPYEILMKDIRNYKYNLRKIMVNGDVPSRVAKDAHAIILEFIRSRPPLRSASDRQLGPPPPKMLTPREQLLQSIKKGRKLRPVPIPRTSRNRLETQIVPQKDNGLPPKPAVRKLIKVDFSQVEDDDDDDLDNTPDSSEPGLWSNESPQTVDGTLEAYDLATEYARASMRRNTLGVEDSNIGCYSVPQSRPCSRQSCNSSEAESVLLEPEAARQIQEELTCSQNWQDSISLDDRLSLTLAEIVHIRTVLTKAELEALPVEGKVRHDVEARKVCFLCLKTRFGIFGPWGQRCTLCKRTVCTRCCSRMNIPMEHFSSVPVVLLSPSIMCTPEEEAKESIAKSLAGKIGTNVDTGPASDRPSPEFSRPGTSMESSTISDPGSLGRFRTRAVTVGRAARAVERLKGSQTMVVCHDCKMMVLQIIKSARANRSAIRNKTLQSLTLNLSPVF